MKGQKCKRNEALIERLVARMKEVRNSRGLTQENVRFDTELNIGRIESGLHCISLPTLTRLCVYYQITLEEFFRDVVTQ